MLRGRRALIDALVFAVFQCEWSSEQTTTAGRDSTSAFRQSHLLAIVSACAQASRQATWGVFEVLYSTTTNISAEKVGELCTAHLLQSEALQVEDSLKRVRVAFREMASQHCGMDVEAVLTRALDMASALYVLPSILVWLSRVEKRSCENAL